MKKERTYFAWLQLEDGRFVNLVFTSDNRRGTWGNVSDLLAQAYNHKVTIKTSHYIRKVFRRGHYYNEIYMHDFIYPMDKKHMDEECFDEYETIDLREGEQA